MESGNYWKILLSKMEKPLALKAIVEFEGGKMSKGVVSMITAAVHIQLCAREIEIPTVPYK